MGTDRKYEGVRAASDTTIEIDFRYQGARCRERIDLEPTPANLKRAFNHRASILAAIDAGTFDYAATFPQSKRRSTTNNRARMTLGAYLEQWYNDEALRFKVSVRVDTDRTVKLLVKALGNIYLDEFKRTDMKSWCAQQTCGNKRLTNIQSVLRTALQLAVEEYELIEINPMHGWKYEKRDALKRVDDVDPFTYDEQKLILATMLGQVRNLFQFAFWTGLRTSELCALLWEDVDFELGTVRIYRAITQNSDVAEDPKTMSGNRTVKLLGPAREALKAQLDYTREHAFVFHNPQHNAPWQGDGPIRKTAWTPALKLAGVRYRRPYQTRHTYASMMLTAGEDPMWVAQQMGHKDWGMIRTTYGKWIPDARPDAGERAEKLFGQPVVSNPR